MVTEPETTRPGSMEKSMPDVTPPGTLSTWTAFWQALVVIITTSDNPTNIIRCERLGCDGYIVKPLDGTLVDRLNSLLEKSLSTA